MGQKELVNTMAVKMGTTKKAAKEALDAVINTIEDALRDGEKVSLNKFGTFEVRSYGERQGTNPQTKEKIVIPAMKRPAFKHSKVLKALVNGEV